MRVKIKATKKDIDLGRPLTRFCPIALALKRKFNSNIIKVNGYYWQWGTMKFRLPETVQKFIWKFDLKKPVYPIAFEIEI